uniref:Transmembrane protein n=1 Tax=Medicago truncatula TaxID=3880 RepID=I3T1Z9_MEDTR|nr:unknown [Medicago truncatula]
MATSLAPLSISSVGGSHVKSPELFSTKRNSALFGPKLAAVQRKSNLVTRRNLISPVRAEHRNNRGGDLVAGFLLGGAIFGTLAYVFAPQIRKSLLNEDEYGFRRARRPPYYYDEGLERTRETLNDKIRQLNSAIDNISSRLRGNKKVPAAAPPLESDPEFEGV